LTPFHSIGGERELLGARGWPKVYRVRNCVSPGLSVVRPPKGADPCLHTTPPSPSGLRSWKPRPSGSGCSQDHKYARPVTRLALRHHAPVFAAA
jgi:hypothetical protein